MGWLIDGSLDSQLPLFVIERLISGERTEVLDMENGKCGGTSTKLQTNSSDTSDKCRAFLNGNLIKITDIAYESKTDGKTREQQDWKPRFLCGKPKLRSHFKA